MSDSIALKVLPEMRDFLENLAERHQVGICEAGRIAIGHVMALEKAGEEI